MKKTEVFIKWKAHDNLILKLKIFENKLLDQ